MAYVVMARMPADEPLKSPMYSYGLYSYGLYGYGLYSYGLYGYGLCSYGQDGGAGEPLKSPMVPTSEAPTTKKSKMLKGSAKYCAEALFFYEAPRSMPTANAEGPMADPEVRNDASRPRPLRRRPPPIPIPAPRP